MGPHGRRERSETPLRDYVPEPRHPPAYYAQPGQSTRAYPSGNTASYHPSNPAPIQPTQQPSSEHYRPYEYAPEPQDRRYNQAAYQRQYQTPYHTSSTVERAPYEQALPNYGYGAYASALPGQPSGGYQQDSRDVPWHPYAKASKNDAWDAAVRQVLEEQESAVQHPSSLRGNTEPRPRSRRSSRERGHHKETRTKRSGRDASTEEAVGEPARTTKRPKGRHDSSDIVNVTRALDQVSLTAPAGWEVRVAADRPAKWTEKMARQRLKRAEESPTQREERLAGDRLKRAEEKAEKAKSEPHLPPLSHEENMEIALAKEAERKEQQRIYRQQPEAKEKDRARKRKYNEKKKKK